MGLFEFNAIKNNPKRSSFDLSRHQPFTAKAGELLPVYRRLVYPGDKFQLKHQHFTRTMPVNTAAFARIREYFDWYFVPLRLLNKNIGQALVHMQDNPVQAQGLTVSKRITEDIPHTTLNQLGTVLGTLSNDKSYPNSIGEEILNAFGFKVSALSYKLLRYLRYGNFTYSSNYGYSTAPGSDFMYSRNLDLNLNVHILYPLAYQKIYADHFRFNQWEKNEPFTYNCDWYSGGDFLSSFSQSEVKKDFLENNNFLTLRYCNWNKDMFMGIMPDQQLGDVATVTTGEFPQLPKPLRLKAFNSGDNEYRDVYADPISSSTPRTANLSLYEDDFTFVNNGLLGVLPAGVSTEFSVIQLRIAEALQRYKEISQCADTDYKSQLEAHFGVHLSNALSDKCLWIGGSSTNIDINEVENTNLTDGEATQKGKGIGTGQSSDYFEANEHGVLMCIYHVVPLLDYVSSGQPADLLYTNTADLPQPEFDSIGLQSIPIFQFWNSKSMKKGSIEFPMGYLPRYYELKTDYDSIMGAFETTLRPWVVALDPEYLGTWMTNSITTATASVINYNFFKVNPSIMDSIFLTKADSTVDTDQFLVNAYFDVKATRNFDYDGMPY